MFVAEPRIQGDLFNGKSDSDYLSDQIITYIGNKRALLDLIGEGLKKAKSRIGKSKINAFDVFSGSGIVSRYLKHHSAFLHSNDLERYVEVINRCYLANPCEIDFTAIESAVDYINREASKNPRSGFISELYAPDDDNDIKEGERVFYTTRNAQFIDTARQLIDEQDTTLRDHLLGPLLYKASVHTNTSGVFKGFYKNSRTGLGQFGGDGRNALSRIMGDIFIPMPVFSGCSCDYMITRLDANKATREYGQFEYDVAYVDPPYNQHPYGSNYFMLNLIADYERPEDVSRVSGIPTNWNRSRYNKRQHIHRSLADLIEHLNAKMILVSYNSEGYICEDEMIELLAMYGRVETISTQYNTFRGSRNLGMRDIYVTENLYLLEKS